MKANDKLTIVTKELKHAKTELKKSERLVNEMTKTLDSNNRKIAELESCNTRLRLLKEQAVETSIKNSEAKNYSCGNSGTDTVKDKYDERHKHRNHTSPANNVSSKSSLSEDLLKSSLVALKHLIVLLRKVEKL